MTTVTCPTCNQSVPWTPQSRYRPFCSERCKLIDLGEWASEAHVISDKAVPHPEMAEFDEFELPANDEFFRE